jgi:hypothetical protein
MLIRRPERGRFLSGRAVPRDAPPGRAEVLSDFAHCPVVQHSTSAQLERFFGLKGTKVIGFKKSGLALPLAILNP